MLLPKRITRKYYYDYDGKESEIKLYPVEYFDEAVSLVYKSIKDDINVETIYRRNKIKHILSNNEIKAYLSDEQYFKALKIAFFKTNYHLEKIEAVFEEDKLIGYNAEIYPLIKKNYRQKSLSKKAK